MTLNVSRPGQFCTVRRTVRWCWGDWTIDLWFEGGDLVNVKPWRHP